MYTALINSFSSVVPDVAQNTHRFYRAHWERFWVGELPPVVATGGVDSGAISRWTLFQLGTELHDGDAALNFYAGVSAWAAGTAARSVYRACKPLADPEFGDKLHHALVTFREYEPAQAYHQWNRQSHLPFVGPSQFTKLMYFSTRNPLYAGDQLPLILDGRIAKALGMKQVSNWTASTYDTYLGTCARIAHEWGPSVTAEDVECQLTELGIRALVPRRQPAHTGSTRISALARAA